MKILFCGGGTGGHLFPIIAITREIKRLSDDQNIQFYYIGPRSEVGEVVLAQENFKIYNILSSKLRNYSSFENFSDMLIKFPISILQSFCFLFFVQPDIVFSKGGTGSLPVAIAAKALQIPIFLHESDTVPGKSNQKAAPFAKKIFTSFSKTAYFNPEKTVLVGNPIQKELLEGTQESAKEIFNVTLQKPILLFLGGSQGAQTINDFILTILQSLLEKYEVIHMCGKKNYQEIKDQAEVILDKNLQESYHLHGFLTELELKHAYKVSDLIISRSGSGSIFEIAAVGKPAILIPLPTSAGNHQSKNAYEYAKTGAAIVVEEENLNPNFFLEKIRYLISNGEELEKMKQGALKFSKPLAAKAIAREILEYLNENKK